MATFTQYCGDTVTAAPYCRAVYKQYDDAPSSGVWGTLRAANGSVMGSSTPRCAINSLTSPTGQFQYVQRASLGFDLSSLPTKYYNVTSASIYAWTSIDVNEVYSDTNAGIIPVLLDESVKVAATAAYTDYQAILAGSGTAIASGINHSSLTNGGYTQFSLNASGLAYLSTVLSKSTFPGYAFMGFMFVGDVNNVTPTWGSSGADVNANIGDTGGFQTYLTFEYDEMVKINIGDAWKVVDEIQINVGNVWKDVDELNINIGDVWKEQK